MMNNQETKATGAASHVPPPPICSAKITVRFVDDHTEGRCWFEEQLTNGQWVMIPKTKYASEGNSRHALAGVIEERRQKRLMVFRNIGKEETFDV
jgi:hypothetical protein